MGTFVPAKGGIHSRNTFLFFKWDTLAQKKGIFSLYKKSVRDGGGGGGGGAHVPIANLPPPASRPLYVCTGETQENRILYLLN
jgi:hypothetical protein